MANPNNYKYSLSRVSISPQQINSGSTSPQILIARVVAHQISDPVSVEGVPIIFVVSTDTADGPRLRLAGSMNEFQGSVLVKTDKQGFAYAEVSAGNTSGNFTIQARQVDSIGSPVTYNMQITPPHPVEADVASLQIINGNPQIAFLGDSLFPIPLQVKALNQAGNPVASATINFQIEGITRTTFATGSTTASVSTDSGGLSSPLPLMAGTTPAIFKVTASVKNISVVFELALGPAKSDFFFDPPNDSPFLIRLGVPNIIEVNILDKTQKGWPYISYNATLPSSSNVGFTSPPAQSRSQSGQMMADINGRVTLPPIVSEDVGPPIQVTITTAIMGLTASYTLRSALARMP